MCLGLKPHQAPASSKTVYDVLNRLLGSGLAFQPEPRAWAFADPLLASWVRDHAPPWALRRSGYARASFPRGEANRDAVPPRSRPR